MNTHKIFISYSSKNRRYARIIYKCLKKYFDVWIDEKGLVVGEDFERKIPEEIENRNIFILLLSKEFWNSDFIYEKELPKIWQKYHSRSAYMIPFILDDINNLDDKRGNYILNKGFSNLNAIPRDTNGNLTSIKYLGLKKSLENLIKSIKNLPFTETYFRFSLDILKLLHYNCKYEKIENIEIKKNEVIFMLDGKIRKQIYLPIENEYYREYIAKIFEMNLRFKEIKDKIYKEKIITKAFLEEKFGYIFPSPNKVYKKIFKTSAINNLIQKIKNKRKIHIIAPAGVGKTSAMKYIQKEFLKEKIVVFYDVFGEGNYKENKRYKKEKILQQIINEIAVLTGLEPINNGNFEEKLKEYLYKLSKWNKKVLIIIDAVDNAISALKEEGDKNFIAEFLNWDFPENVELIVTSREGKRAEIGIDLEKIELQPFLLEDTKKFLKFNHIKTDIEKFHYLTKGIGRVCEYAIKDINEFMKNKKPVKIEEIFQLIFDNDTDILLQEKKEIFEILVLLKRPININDIVKIFKFRKDKIINVINALNPGMYIENKEIIFKDEDFEKFLEDKIENKKEIHKKIAEKLLSYKNLEYSIKAIAYHLYNANLKEELFKIALEKIEFENEIIKKEIEKERIDLALKVVFNERNYFIITKLLLKALEIKKSEYIIEEFIDNDQELIFLKGIEKGVNELEKRLNNEQLFLLAYYIYDKDKEKAEFFYKQAQNSILDLSRFNNLSSIKNLAYYLSFKYALFIEKLNKKEILINQNYQIWFELEIIRHLKIDFNLTKEEFKKMHILKQLLIVYLEYKKGNKLYINYIDNNFKLDNKEINNLLEKEYEKDIRDILGIELSEIFLIEGKNYFELLKIFNPKDFYGSIYFKDYKNTIFYFTLWFPNELLINDLDEKNKKFINNLKLIYDFYVLSLRNEIDIKSRWEDLFKVNFFKAYNNGYEEKYLEFQKHLILFKIAVLKLKDKINIILERLLKIPWYDFEIIEFLISQKEKTLALQLIENYFEKIYEEEIEIREKIDNLIKLSKIVKKFDEEYANEILKIAIDLINGIDDNIYQNFEIVKSIIKTTSLEKEKQKEIITTLYNSIKPINNYTYKFRPYYLVKDIAKFLDEEIYLGICYRLDLYNYDSFENCFDYFLNKDLSIKEKFAFRYFVDNKKLLNLLKDTPLYNELIKFILIFEKNESKYNLLKNVDNKEAQKFVQFYEKEIFTKSNSDCNFEINEENYKALLKKHFLCKEKIFKELFEKNIISKKELLDLMFDNIHYFSDFCEIFFKVLEYPLFKIKKKEYIKRAIELYSKYLSVRNWSSLKYDYFFQFLSEEEVIDILLEKNLNVFSDEIYIENIGYLIEIVSNLLTNEEKKEILKENLKIITQNIELNNYEIEEINLLEFLWRFLSHPDKRKRWKSMYILKDLIYANPNKYLRIVKKLNDKQPYENKYILNLSGIWYLLMLLHKISYEKKEVLSEIEKKLLSFFNQTNHILFKKIIKEILINFDKKYENRLKFEVISKSNYLKCNYLNNEKFKSDYMRNNWDTIHYWYSSIANIFGINMQEIITIADKYLKKWNISIKNMKYKDIELNIPPHDRRNNYFLTDNRHGSFPTIEKLNIYLEFHLMFYIVGELLNEKSVCVDFYSDGVFDRFDDWIKRFYINNSQWCSDKLSPFPLIKAAFKDIELNEFDENEYYILKGEINNFSINSAFINKRFEKKFSEIIEKYKNLDYYEFAFPGYDFEEEEWIKQGYLIKPFEIIYENHCEIQDDDPFNRSYCYELKSKHNFIKYKEWGEEKDLHSENKKGYTVYCEKEELIKFLKEHNVVVFRMFIKNKKTQYYFKFDNIGSKSTKVPNCP
jgi:hypothetical protein